MNVEPCWEAWRLAITIIMIVIFNWTSMSFKIMWVQPYKAKNKKYLCTKVVRSTGKDVDTPEPIRNNPLHLTLRTTRLLRLSKTQHGMLLSFPVPCSHSLMNFHLAIVAGR